MTAIVQEAPPAAPQARIPPHVLIVGKKHAVDYIAPALFRLGSFGELVVRAKGGLSIVTAVNVAEMVKKDIEDLQTRSINIGTEEFQVDGSTRRISFIEIHIAKPLPVVPVVEAPIVAVEQDVLVHVPVEEPVEILAQPEAPEIPAAAPEAPTMSSAVEVPVAVAAPAKKVRVARKKTPAKRTAAKRRTIKKKSE